MKKLDIKVIYRDQTTKELKDDPIFRITDPSVGIKIKSEDDEKYEFGCSFVCSDDDVTPGIGYFVKEALGLYFEKEKTNNG